MSNSIQNMEGILDGAISGFHIYRLEDPVTLCYVSGSLCAMLGCSREELAADAGDPYESHVHPADRGLYAEFLNKLHREGQSRTAQYRLLKQDGTVLYVSDTVTVSRQEDGTQMGYSVLTDITALKNENRNLRFLDETMPCGFIRYTCGDPPRVTYINDRMMEFLRFPEGDSEELARCRQNIYLMIPMEERSRFGAYLDRVRQEGGPIAGEMTVQRFDGTRAYLFGWVTKCVNARGQEEFQSVCMDMTQRHMQLKEREKKQYVTALTEVYDKIFEFDLANRTVKCLCAKNSPMFRFLLDLPMQMEEATEKWITGTAFEEDREALRAFFGAFYRRQHPEDGRPPMIRYRALSSAGALQTYTGLFVKLDESASLFCCRKAADPEADSLREENTSLKGINENMQKLVMRFTDGLAAFEVIDDVVTPLYASDNVCGFFGFTREQWLEVMKKRTPIREFVSRSRAEYEDFRELLEKGEAEFVYYDHHRGQERRIRAICSRKFPEGSAPRYVMLYNVDEGAKESREEPRVYIRTFGYFDVFVDGRPIAFRNEKSKELFALLADRRGGFVSSEEAIGYLWEDEPVSPVTLARYRKVALRLKNLLEEYGIADIVESVNGKRRLAADRVQCDLYDYLTGREEYAQLFKGSYLTNYSWGETTLAELTGEHLY